MYENFIFDFALCKSGDHFKQFIQSDTRLGELRNAVLAPLVATVAGSGKHVKRAKHVLTGRKRTSRTNIKDEPGVEGTLFDTDCTSHFGLAVRR